MTYWKPIKIYQKFDVISGPGAPGNGSGASRGSFSITFHVLRCLGAQVMNQNRSWGQLGIEGPDLLVLGPPLAKRRLPTWWPDLLDLP